jgi:hypothetical protein
MLITPGLAAFMIALKLLMGAIVGLSVTAIAFRARFKGGLALRGALLGVLPFCSLREYQAGRIPELISTMARGWMLRLTAKVCGCGTGSQSTNSHLASQAVAVPLYLLDYVSNGTGRLTIEISPLH